MGTRLMVAALPFGANERYLMVVVKLVQVQQRSPFASGSTMVSQPRRLRSDKPLVANIWAWEDEKEGLGAYVRKGSFADRQLWIGTSAKAEV